MSTPTPPKPAKAPRTGPTFQDRLKSFWNALKRLVRRTVPVAGDDENARLFKKIAWSLIGMAALVVFLAVSVFFLSLKGQEETMIPKVVGKDLISAILELQEKELVPTVQVKFSTDPREKGNVIAQEPEGGLLSKSGRRVTLWVSKGAVVDTVENYVGMNVGDVQLHLKSLFSTQAQPLITLGNDATYVDNSSPEGTVIEQQPAAGTSLGSPVALKLIVSRGPKGQTVRVGTYTNQAWLDALKSLATDNIPFVITVRKAEGTEKAGQFVSQAPAPSAEISKGSPVSLTLTEPPSAPDGRTFHLLKTTLPEYPILVDLKIVLRRLSGDVVELLLTKSPGGNLTFPYLATAGDILSVMVLDKEIYAQKVE